MCLNCSGTMSPGHVRVVPDHEHTLSFVGVRKYEVWRCPVCGKHRYVPVLESGVVP